jgi:hypothetical protein
MNKSEMNRFYREFLGRMSHDCRQRRTPDQEEQNEPNLGSVPAFGNSFLRNEPIAIALGRILPRISAGNRKSRKTKRTQFRPQPTMYGICETNPGQT